MMRVAVGLGFRADVTVAQFEAAIRAACLLYTSDAADDHH